MKRSYLISGSNQSGFTLLEILIAITILAFITLGVVDITENAALTMERTTEANTNNLQIETAMSRFEWDISQIYSPLYFSTVMNLNQNVNNGAAGGNQGGVDSGVESGTDSGAQAGVQAAAQAGAQGGAANNPYLQQYYEQLIARFERNEHFSAVSQDGQPIPRFYAPEKNVFEFFTSSNRRKLENQQQSHFAWVRYSLAEQAPLASDDENPNIPKSLKSLVRYFTADDPYSDKRINIEDEERIKGAVLLRNVENLEFQFWDYQKRKWETSLRSIPSGENIIRGVKMLVTWYDSLGHKRTTTRIFRTHWPMVAPQDQQQNQGMTAGVQTGVQAGATAAGGVAGADGGQR
jgi:prepilin-type N-terminal cleavage/methylation domain-containing protein